MEGMPEKMDKQQPPASRPPFLHINVQLVSIWTFFNAVTVIVSVVVAVAYYTLVATHSYPSQQALCLLPRAAMEESTGADDTLQVSVSVVPATGMLPQAAAAGGALALLLPCHSWRVLVLTIGMLWCSTPQAVAAALALLLPHHRRRVLRRAAAYAALALTVASHCMFAGTVLVLVRDDPEGLGLFFTIMGTSSVFMCAVVDLLGFLVLHRGGDEVEPDDDLLGFLRGRED